MQGLIVLLVIVAFFIWLDWYVKRSWAKQISVLAAAPCRQCGKPFGAEAAVAARDGHLVACQQMRAMNPGWKIHLREIWAVGCPSCDTRSYYDPRYRRLLVKGRKHVDDHSPRD